MAQHVQSRRDFLKLAAAAVGAVAPAALAKKAASAKKPNFLLIIGDDITHRDLGCYGGRNVKTPNIGGFAKQGMRFRKAFVAMSMCCPCRHELYTGLYPLSNGAAWNHSKAKPGTKSICHHLGELGYRVGLAGKLHVGPRDSFPFVDVPGFERGCCSRTAKYDCESMKRFITADPDRPWCLVLAMVLAHSPWNVGDASQFPLDQLKLPPSFADTKEVRQDYANYLAEIAALDKQIADLLQALDQTGQADNTLVVFTSEQGSQFPFAKWSCWEQGMHTAFLARWPGRIKAGAETDAIVQYADVVPTFLQAAGGEPKAKNFDGTSFLDVLLGKKTSHRTYAYGLHNNVPEGPPYPSRTIRGAEFRYIRNLTPEAEYFEKHVEMPKQWGGHWESWKKAAQTDPHAKAMLRRYRKRPAEELYRSDEDPWEMTNLAADPKYAKVKAALSAELDRWMESQGDPGAAQDTMEKLTANRQAAAPKRKPKTPRRAKDK